MFAEQEMDSVQLWAKLTIYKWWFSTIRYTIILGGKVSGLNLFCIPVVLLIAFVYMWPVVRDSQLYFVVIEILSNIARYLQG